MRAVDVLVIGAGQAGLSAAYHLQRRGFVPATRASEGDRSFVVLDAEAGPGGAWRHRWETLRMGTVNGIHELPGFAVPPADPQAASRDVLPAYFAEYEARFGLEVQRPVRVTAVRHSATPVSPGVATSSGDEDPQAPLIVDSDAGQWAADYVINATGTWTRPFWPHYPGQETFRGRQLHVHDYVSADEFAGQRVVIVGAGISATQLLEEISHVAETFWVTRTEPEWVELFDEATILASLAKVDERTRNGLPPSSVVHVTGMHRAPWVERGRSLDEPRLFVIGYGSSQSTIGANRAGRDAVRAILAEIPAAELS